MPSYRGELRLPSKPAIAATHQGAADSNEALPRRGRGAANAEAWRGDGGSRLLACSSPPHAWFRRRRHRRRRQRRLCVAEALLLRGLVLLASRARQLGPASCRGGGRVDDVALGSASSQRQESSPQIGSLRRALSRTFVVASHKLCAAFRAACSRRRRRAPAKQSGRSFRLTY